MKSFGLWYLANGQVDDTAEVGSGVKKSELSTVNEKAEEENEKPEFDLHINFWSLEDYKHIVSENIPCLDIGIKICRYKLIDKLTFFCPFKISENNIRDLAEKMTTKNNANIIFNTDCEIQTKDNYTIVEVGEEKLLVFPLDQVIKEVYSVEPIEFGTGTKLEFKFQNFQKYVNSNEELEKFDTIYIRFRINGNALADNIYFDSEPLNKSFESAFSGTRMIDFKINEKRNIEEKVRAEIIVNHEEMAGFRRVHFLVMEPSAYDVSSFDDLEMSCRELEEGLWDDYLGAKIDFAKGHILAYHWKTKGCSKNFSCLVKVNYSKTKGSIILMYAFLVVVLGIISSAIVTGISILASHLPYNLASMLICIVVGVGIVLAGVYRKKKSK